MSTAPKFNSIINELFTRPTKFIILSYASQLVQYFTIISDPNFVPEQDFSSFVSFLNENTQFGQTTQNLFIAEYKLIKIYNGLSDLVDSETSVIAKVDDSNDKRMFLLEQLKELEPQVSDWAMQAPDNLFIQYLDFCVYYCFAKALELQFSTRNTPLSEEEKVALGDSQQTYLEHTQDTLKRMKELQESTICSTRGIEFSLGQDVFHRTPANESNAVESHINSLLHP